ncbi:MAG: hypothetical protein FWE84_03625 [Firmicutes bacterium]|nr:hypothetical protein [Bacillota bacterium]
MILSAIFHFLKKIFGTAVKIIAWLLVALSLWVPLLYTLVFVVACGITETSITSVQSWYWGGLAVSFVGSFLVSTFIYERRIAKKKQKKLEPAPVGDVEKVKEKSDEPQLKKRDGELTAAADLPVDGVPDAGLAPISPASNTPPSGPSLMDRLKQGAPELKTNTDTASKHNFISYGEMGGNREQVTGSGERGGYNQGRDGQSGYSSGYNQGEFGNNQGFGINQGGFGANYPGYGSQGTRGGFGEQDYDNYRYPGFSRGSEGEGRPASNILNSGRDGQDYGDTNDAGGRGFGDGGRRGVGGFGRGGQDYGDASGNGESPKIFVTRSDPTVLIYEYSDRLDYYKRTRSGLLLFKTRQKEANEG